MPKETQTGRPGGEKTKEKSKGNDMQKITPCLWFVITRELERPWREPKESTGAGQLKAMSNRNNFSAERPEGFGLFVSF